MKATRGRRMLRDVMNSKAGRLHRRRSINAYNHNLLSEYYAIESRVYSAVWDEELRRLVKGGVWFMNELVFDFDFDEAHFPNVTDYEQKLSDSLEKLYKVMGGKPKFIITNKASYTQEEIETYFTNEDGNVSIPKKHGCQVVYELKESIKSQYLEQVKLFNRVRMIVTEEVEADMNFRGHMFKNYYNEGLFNIEKPEASDVVVVDLKNLSSKYIAADELAKIYRLDKFETLVTSLPKSFVKANNILCERYNNLNTWKISGRAPEDSKSAIVSSDSFNVKCDSRNETLFNYLKYIPIEEARNTNYGDVVNSNLFSDCSITSTLEEVEFNSTKASVIAYREENVVEAGENYYKQLGFRDGRVFKWESTQLDIGFFSKNASLFSQAFSMLTSSASVKMPDGNSVEIKDIESVGYNHWAREAVANLFLRMGPELILSNVRSIMTPEVVSFIHYDVLKSDYRYRMIAPNGLLGLFDMMEIIWDAIFLTHFAYYNAVKEYRSSGKMTEFAAKQKELQFMKDHGHKIQLRKQMASFGAFKEFDSPYDFKPYYEKMLKSMSEIGIAWLKEDGRAQPISFYQVQFHCSNAQATQFSRLIKSYLKSVEEKAENLRALNELISYDSNVDTESVSGSLITVTMSSELEIFTPETFTSLMEAFTITSTFSRKTIGLLSYDYDNIIYGNADRLKSSLLYHYDSGSSRKDRPSPKFLLNNRGRVDQKIYSTQDLQTPPLEQRDLLKEREKLLSFRGF